MSPRLPPLTHSAPSIGRGRGDEVEAGSIRGRRAEIGAGVGQSTQAPLVNATTNTTAAGAHTHR